jgi:hypothetical protein
MREGRASKDNEGSRSLVELLVAGEQAPTALPHLARCEMENLMGFLHNTKLPTLG